jgi:hypothetical protein
VSADCGDSPLPFEPDLVADLAGPLARLCDGELEAQDWSRLHRILHANSGAREYYLRYIALHCSLATAAANPLGCFADTAQLAVERMTLERFAGRIGPTALCAVEPSRSLVHARSRAVARWSASLSAVLVVAMAVLWWAYRERPGDHAQWVIAIENTPHVSRNRAGFQPLAAEITYVSDATIWRNPNRSYALASSVRSGQSLTLERGQIELTYSSGTKLLLTGPSDFVAQPKGGKLRRGELVARVPEAGHGFTIETPHGKVVDLGTEFGVVVDDFGVSQVSVFEGKVETMPSAASGAAGKKIELTSGRAILWTDKSIIPIDVHGHRYQTPEQRSAIGRRAPLPRASLDDDFRGQSLAPDRWKTLGEVVPTDNGLRLGGGAGHRPFLITARQFDPALGAIVVVCDLRFETAQDAENGSFAILTRCSDQQSKPGAPWQEMLARSVRCRLMTELRSGEGMLEAGTKYEADRELSNISWSGFSRPKADTLYRLEMRDDGLNVSFTVSQAANPLARKTITCRSLFRGSHNFIALEGSSIAPAIIERIAISQESSVRDDDRLAEGAVEDVTASMSQSKVLAKQLDQLSPTNGLLLLKDEFDGSGLNSAIWTSLGDVVLKDGQAQLGLPNSEQHIDTWHARPYLLTKRHIDPADGPIFVIGKVTFAENFLHGYGGSFAVMTRADNERGTGPGWENSILCRGIRANFWPAAFGFNHSLEIHEKPDPNTLLLLTAKGFEISPTSRSYLFRLKDDGRSATLTVIDAANSVIQRTLAVATTSLSSRSGHVGFESCWGSPVLLDSIRIYRADDASETRFYGHE